MRRAQSRRSPPRAASPTRRARRRSLRGKAARPRRAEGAGHRCTRSGAMARSRNTITTALTSEGPAAAECERVQPVTLEQQPHGDDEIQRPRRGRHRAVELHVLQADERGPRDAQRQHDGRDARDDRQRTRDRPRSAGARLSTDGATCHRTRTSPAVRGGDEDRGARGGAHDASDRAAVAAGHRLRR